jgi:peptidoglycan/LPS O-acetylase OafA/YrhL
MTATNTGVTATGKQAAKPTNPHIPTLDGIRAVSFAIVFLAHAGLGSQIPGGFGVTVFFFLSGYLIATLLRQEIETTGTVHFRNFYLRRVLRILPPFYLTLAAAVCLTLLGILPGRLQLMPTLSQFLHFANYWQVWRGGDGQPAGTAVYWSLAVEEHFYLIFPWLYLALFRFSSNTRAIAILLLCGVVLCWRCYLILHLGAPEERTYVATDARFDSLLFGCLLASWSNPALDRPNEPAGLLWKWLLLPISVGLLLLSFLWRSEEFRATLRYTLQGLALIPIFVVGIREPRWGPFRWLNLRWVRFAGTLSYSLYLVHQAVLFALGRWLPAGELTRGALGLGLSWLLALAMHRYVELPSARLRKRLADRQRSATPNNLVGAGASEPTRALSQKS